MQTAVNFSVGLYMYLYSSYNNVILMFGTLKLAIYVIMFACNSSESLFCNISMPLEGCQPQ